MFQYEFILNYLINVSLIFDEQLPSFAAWFVFLLLESSTFLSAGDKIQANSMCYLLPIVNIQISKYCTRAFVITLDTYSLLALDLQQLITILSIPEIKEVDVISIF